WAPSSPSVPREPASDVGGASKIADPSLGNYLAQNAQGGVLQGVTPVALSLPSYARAVHVSREIVTRDRPFRPTLVYLTSTATWPLALLWLAGAALLAAAHRASIAAVYRRAAERLARRPEEPAEPPAPEAP
ncbi:MAG: hypothetical protein IT372_15695, partial [Polyangiaceae bacterium]|nr:hypothetical protein [Polyangiaceae bacterium]